MHELGLLDDSCSGRTRRRRRSTGADRRRYRSRSPTSRICRRVAASSPSCRNGTSSTSSPSRPRRYPGFRSAHAGRGHRPDRAKAGASSASGRRRPDGPLEVRADLVVGADGRHSTVRERAGLAVEDLGAPMDVLWMRLSRRAGRSGAAARPVRRRPDLRDARPRRLLAVRLRHPEGRLRRASRPRVSTPSAIGSRRLAPFMRDRVGELTDWDDVKLADRRGRPPEAVVPARAAVHRRRRARDVAGRRGRHQPRDPGRGRGRQSSRRSSAAKGGDDRRSPKRPAPRANSRSA